MNTNNGGPAFPRTGGEVPGPNTSEWVTPQQGMPLRDWFAGMALQGILAAQIHGMNDVPSKGPFARLAYDAADSMLAFREPKLPE